MLQLIKMTSTVNMNNVENVIMTVIDLLRDKDIKEGKITRYHKDQLVRTIIHALVRSMYCYSLKLAPMSGKTMCKNNNGLCGYVIGQGIHRWIMRSFNSGILQYDSSVGCSFGHDHSARPFIETIAEFLMMKIPQPRSDDCYAGICRIRHYLTNYMYPSKTQTSSSVLYDDDTTPTTRRLHVRKLDETRDIIAIDAILTDDSIFQDD